MHSPLTKFTLLMRLPLFYFLLIKNIFNLNFEKLILKIKINFKNLKKLKLI